MKKMFLALVVEYRLFMTLLEVKLSIEDLELSTQVVFKPSIGNIIPGEEPALTEYPMIFYRMENM
jgi:hypothetical protein